MHLNTNVRARRHRSSTASVRAYSTLSPTKLLLLTGLLLLAWPGEPAMSYEEPAYTVVATDGDFEQRRYAPYLVVETVIEDARSANAASGEGFKRLFAYISGANNSQTKVSMTVPVSQGESQKIEMTTPVQQSAAAEGWRVSFTLPAEFTRATAPAPNDSRVYVREVPGRQMAVLAFSGRWTEANYRQHEQELAQRVTAAGLTATGPVERAVYNAPFSIPWFRRNEVMVEVR